MSNLVEELINKAKQWRRKVKVITKRETPDVPLDLKAGSMTKMKEVSRAHGEREQSARRYRALVANAPLCIYEIDLQGRVVTMNPTGLRTLGVTDDQKIAGKPFLECIAEEDRPRVRALIEEAYSGATVEFECVASTAKGMRTLEQRLTPLVTGEGGVEGIVGTTRDVTEYRAQREQLREKHEFAEALFRTVQAIVLVLGRDGHIIDFNPFMERLSGYRLDEVRGKDWFVTFLPERDRDRIRRAFERAPSGTRTWGNPIVTSDGRQLDIEWYGSLLTQPKGSVHGLLAIGHDITERKRSEEALAASERKLRELSGRLLSSQEEETRHFSRELHDDLGQRLTVLGMELDHLREHLRGSGGGDEAERKVVALAEVVNGLTKQVSDISHRLHPSTVEHLGLATALARECTGVASATGRSVFLDADDSVPRDAPRSVTMCLYRIAQEAIRNAIAHSGSERVALALAREDDGIRLSVRDWGRGFEAEGERANWGLGLVSMEERSRLGGGTLTVQSRPGEGTIVSCWVPLVEV